MSERPEPEIQKECQKGGAWLGAVLGMVNARARSTVLNDVVNRGNLADYYQKKNMVG